MNSPFATIESSQGEGWRSPFVSVSIYICTSKVFTVLGACAAAKSVVFSRYLEKTAIEFSLHRAHPF